MVGDCFGPFLVKPVLEQDGNPLDYLWFLQITKKRKRMFYKNNFLMVGFIIEFFLLKKKSNILNQ